MTTPPTTRATPMISRRLGICESTMIPISVQLG
jgi:hypothetical protein